MKKILSTDGGITETFHYSAHDDTAAIQRVSNVSEILDANKLQRDSGQGYKSEVFNKVASIDVVVLDHWCKNKGINFETFFADEKVFKSFLNDPDNKAWRTTSGKI